MKQAIKRLICAALCFAMLAGFIPLAAAETGYDRGFDGGMAGTGNIYAHGLDVSAWQESGLNFQNFANAGYDFVILRCGTSKRKDACFDEYYASAKAAGLDVGCYYYSYATSVSEALVDAENMISWMGDKVFEYPIYFDYEDQSQAGIDGTTASKICLAFMNKLRDHGYLVGLYSMSSWLEKSWITSSGIRDTYEGWVAHLPSEEPNNGKYSNLYMIYHDLYSTRYGMYQYSFDTYVNGQGPFDCNVCYKDYPSIVRKYGFNGYAEQESWIEKATFDPWVYKNRYDDLKDKTDEQLKAHWLAYGIKEGRCASAVLDLRYYVDNNPDLKTAFGTDYEKAYQHFITKGYQEQRKSSLLFDGSYYCNRYPEVVSSFKKDYLRHYVQNGMKEGRRASATFDVNYYLFTRPDVAKTWPDDLERAARHYAGYGIKEGRAGYDSTFPTITDVTVTDVSAAGYTVTCKVTDDWGVSKVAFPTWTVANNQDDLAADFLNTQKGTKDGNTYTFRVNASDHNNEGGKYVTHIYAVDKGGNTAKLVVDLVTVEDQAQVVVPTLAGKGFSLSFEDEILVNFYYEISDATDVAEQGMLVFNTNPGTADISKADDVYKGSTYVASNGRYLNTTEGIAAKEMGDTRYYAAYAKLADGSYVYSKAYDYSPRKYATNLLAKASTSEGQKALCVAMLNYGAAAQSYFGYKTDDLMNASLTAAQKALVANYNAGYFTGAVAADSSKTANFAKTDGFTSKAATVSFEGAFAVNYYFAPNAAVTGDMTLYIWTPEAYASAARLTSTNASTVTMVKQSNGTYWAQVEGIPAKALDSTYYVAATYTDTAGNHHCTGVIAYSLSKYCMGKAADSTMGALARATAMYGYYAGQYFANN